VYLSFLFLTYGFISNIKRLGRISFLITSIFYSFKKIFFTTNLLHPLYPLLELHSSVRFLINMFVIRFVFVLDEVALFCSLS
jgi:hypothetical protein